MSPSSDTLPRGRLRLDHLDQFRDADGALRVQVGLEWGYAIHRATRRGMGTREGALRAGASAALDAAQQATLGAIRLDLVGIKAVRAFDSWLVISSIEVVAESGRQRLLGARQAPDNEMAIGAVLSVLDALNRVLTAYLPPVDRDD